MVCELCKTNDENLSRCVLCNGIGCCYLKYRSGDNSGRTICFECDSLLDRQSVDVVTIIDKLIDKIDRK